MITIAQIVTDAIAAKDSGLKFCIDFDLVWKPLGYRSRKVAARRLIFTCVDKHDYLLRVLPKEAQNQNVIMMTFDAFVILAAIAQTVEGRQVRQLLADRERGIIDDLERAFTIS